MCAGERRGRQQYGARPRLVLCEELPADDIVAAPLGARHEHVVTVKRWNELAAGAQQGVARQGLGWRLDRLGEAHGGSCRSREPTTDHDLQWHDGAYATMQ